MADLPSTAQVLVIGGGAVGTSIAYHLAAAGVSRVVVLERARIGSGATSKAAGGIRVQFPLPVEVQFSLHSLELFHHFREQMGADAEFRSAGYLFLIADEGSVPKYRALWQMQRDQGANVL